MPEKQKSSIKKPYVIVISGSVGSGKSTIAASLSRMLEDAPVLTFDHYEQVIEWPQEINQWMRDGADPNQIRVPKLKEDLLSLLDGAPITDPFNGIVMNPAKYIILEEPSGRERHEIEVYIDLVVFIDVPQDVCVARIIERLMNMGVWKSQGTFEGETKENLVRQLNAIALWITQYRKARSMYIGVSQIVQEKADIVVNGMKTVDEITTDILNAIKTRLQS